MTATDPDVTEAPGGLVLRRTYALMRGLVLALILAVLGHQIWAGRAALTTASIQWRPIELGIAVLVTVAAYQLLFVAWLILLRSAGLYRPGRIAAYARVWWLSYIYRYVPGKVLLLVERARLGRALGIPYATGALFPVIETLVAILAGSVVSLLAITYFADMPRLWIPIAGLVCAVLFLVPPGYRWLARLPMVRKRCPDLETVKLRTADLLLVAIPYITHYLLLGTAFFLLSRCVLPIASGALPGFCGIFALSHVLSLIVVIAPAGLGIREGALAVLLSRAVPAGVAGTLAIGTRLWFTGIEILCFLAVLAFGARHEATIARDRQMDEN